MRALLSWFHCVRARWNMPVYNVLRIMRPHLSEASRAKLRFGHFSIYLMSLSMSMSLSNLLNVTFGEMDPSSGWFAGPCFVSERLYHLLSFVIPNANWWTFAEMAAAKKDKLDHSCFRLGQNISAKLLQQVWFISRAVVRWQKLLPWCVATIYKH